MKSAGLIIGDTAYTNSKGRINRNKGVKNEIHHNFGG